MCVCVCVRVFVYVFGMVTVGPFLPVGARNKVPNKRIRMWIHKWPYFEITDIFVCYRKHTSNNYSVLTVQRSSNIFSKIIYIS